MWALCGRSWKRSESHVGMLLCWTRKREEEAEVTGSSMARWLLRRTESFFYRGLRGPDALSLTSKTVWHPTNGLQPSTGCVFPSPRRSHARTLRQSRPPAWRRTSQDTSRAKGEICELRSPRPHVFRFPVFG